MSCGFASLTLTPFASEPESTAALRPQRCSGRPRRQREASRTTFERDCGFGAFIQCVPVKLAPQAAA